MQMDSRHIAPSLPHKSGLVTLPSSRWRFARRVLLELANGVINISKHTALGENANFIKDCKVDAGEISNSVTVRKRSSSFQFVCDTEVDQREWLEALNRTSMCKPEDFYIIGEQIGAGCNGAVYKAKHRQSGIDVAIKVCHRLNSSPSSEIKIMSTQQHANIMYMYDAFETSSRTFIVMPFMPGGDMASWRRLNELDEVTSRSIIRQVLSGLKYLHHKGIAHHDIKLTHLFCAQSDNGLVVKIGDFGIAKQGASSKEIGDDILDCAEIMKMLFGSRIDSELISNMERKNRRRRYSARKALNHSFLNN